MELGVQRRPSIPDSGLFPSIRASGLEATGSVAAAPLPGLCLVILAETERETDRESSQKHKRPETERKQKTEILRTLAK